MPEPQAESHWRVSLPMYNLPEMQAVNAAFREEIRRALQRARDSMIFDCANAYAEADDNRR